MGKKSRIKKERKMGLIEDKTKDKKEIPKSGLENACLFILRLGMYLILLTPLIVGMKFFFPFVGPKSLYFMGLVEILLAVWLVLLSIDWQRYRPRLNLISGTIILFFIVMVLSAIFGADPIRSFWSKYERMTGVLMWSHLLIFYFIISSVFRKRSDWLKIFTVSLIMAIFVGIINFLPRLGIEKLNFSSRGGATIGNSSFLATYLLFNIFFSFYLFLNLKGKIKIFSGLGLGFIILALLLSTGRAAILSFFGGSVLVFFLYLSFKAKKPILKKLGKILLIFSVLISLAGFFIVSQSNNAINQKFIRNIIPSRIVVWDIAWQGFQEKPLLGWGPENFELVFSKYFNPCLFSPQCGLEVWYDRAHNIVFDILVNSGIIGFLSYLTVFGAVFYSLGKLYFSRMINFWTASIFSVVLVSYFVQNLTVFDMVSSYLMFFLVLGFVGVVYSGLSEKSEVLASNVGDGTVKNKFLLTFLLILISFSFFKFIIQPISANRSAIKTLNTMQSERIVSSDLYEKAVNSSSMGRYQMRSFLSGKIINFYQNQENFTKTPKEKIKKDMDFFINEIEDSIEKSPLDYKSWLILGKLYSFYFRLDPSKITNAEKTAEKILELSPKNQQGYWISAQVKLYKSDFDGAFALAEKAVQLDPGVEQSHLILIQIAKIKGDDKLAEEKANEALKIIPSIKPKIEKVMNYNYGKQ